MDDDPHERARLIHHPMRHRARLLVVAGCFFVSGAAGLLYEVAWLRLLGLLFGHTTHAITAVLAAFMGGLALGSLLLGRWADRVERPLRAYGRLEALIGAYCLATPLLFAAVSRGYLALHRLVDPSATGAGIIQFVLAVALLLVPTTLMGATLPLLSRAVVERLEWTGARVGTLYAINTWGAVAGVAAAGFVLIPAIGVRSTIWLAVALNLLVAATAVLLDRRWSSAVPARRKAARPVPAAQATAAQPAPDAAPPAAARVALAAIAVSGAASMAYEIAWTRALSLAIGSSTYAFTAMLTTFLVGLALGAFAVARVLRRRPLGLAAFAAVECAIALLALALLPAFGRLPDIVLSLLSWSGLSYRGALVAQFAASFLVMIVPTLLIGATFPIVIAALTRSMAGLGAHVGKVYGANTIGTIAGSAGAGFFLIPMLGVQRTVVVGAAANLVAGLAVLLLAPGARRRAFAWGGAAVAAFAALVAVVPRWDAKLMSAGVSVYADRFLRSGEASRALREALSRQELLMYAEGINTTVSVIREDELTSLAVNGKFDASNARTDMMTMLLTGHLGAVLHPDPRRVLVIGLGSGVTVGALAAHPVRTIDVAELEPAMVDAARFFSKEARNALEDPRVKVIAGDGRHVLAAAAEPYDLIVSEPSNPWIAGVGNLFTREFYLAARERLAPGGMVVQWIQGYRIFASEMKMVVRTLREVFPHVTIWQAGRRGDYLLVARTTPLEADFAAIQQRLGGSPDARKDFAQFWLDPEHLLFNFVLSEEDAARFAAGASLNTDDTPLLEFAAPRAAYALSSEQDNDRTLRSFRRVETPPLRGFETARLAGADWRLRAARMHWLWGNAETASDELDRLERAPLLAATRLERARLLFALGRVEAAIRDLESIGPGDRDGAAVDAYLRAARAVQRLRLERRLAEHAVSDAGPDLAHRYKWFGDLLTELAAEANEPAFLVVALEHYARALELTPVSWGLMNQMAILHLKTGNADAAAAMARRAVDLRPADAQLRFNLGLMYEAGERPQQAAVEYGEASRLAPQWSKPRERLAELRVGSPHRRD